MRQSTEDENLDLLSETAIRECRKWFWCYRKFINPGMLVGWWQIEIAFELQDFYNDLIAGKRPQLILEAPPQHGKSIQMVDFVSWVAGHNPNMKTIYASFSDDLGVAANDRLQRIYKSDEYQKVFKTRVGGGSRMNSSIIQYVGSPEGSFINTTVAGQVTGKGLHLGIVDDPIKGRFEADSENNRNKVWNWFTDDFFTRFDENSGLVMMLTRWHLDDPAGRLIASNPNVKMLRYPAIAVKDERYRKKGDPLFPELKSLEFLLERKSIMTQGAWESEYQQNPILVGGNMFKRHWFTMVGAAPADCYWVRRWDLAACLIAGTMVETIDGPKAIETVTTADWVLTRKGYKRVLWAGQSGLVNKVVSVKFANGTVLTGTPDHKIWTQSGWVQLDTLDDGSYTTCLRSKAWQFIIREVMGAGLNLIRRMMLSGLTTTHTRTGLGRNIIGMLESFCTAMCGVTTTVTYPKVMTSTTLTATGEIMQSKILSASPKVSICKAIIGMGGMVLKRLKNTKRKFVDYGLTEQFIVRSFVKSVVKSLSLGIWIQNELSFAPQSADIGIGFKPRNYAHDVVKSSMDNVITVPDAQPNLGSANVCGVVRSSWSRIREQKPDFAAKAVELSGSIPVYDLTVEGEHEFFANGVLVHNSEGGGAFTAGVLMGRSRSTKMFYIKDVQRQQLDGDSVKKLILQTAAIDQVELGKRNYQIWLPQDPGQAGKVQAKDFINLLAGYDVHTELESGDKETRARPYAAQCEAGNVKLVEGKWVREYLDEITQFPAGKYADQVDASSGAFGTLILFPKKLITFVASKGSY